MSSNSLLRTWGMPWNLPGSSDHCPVVMTLANRHSRDCFRRWTVSCLSWPSIFQHQRADRLDPAAPWLQRYQQLRDCMVATAAEIQDLHRHTPASSIEAKLALGIRATCFAC